MSHNILITGGSGYLGGSLLACLSTANLPPYKTLYALVRTESQAAAVSQYNAEPLTIDLTSVSAITSAITSKNITIVFHLFDAIDTTTPKHFIHALAIVKQTTGLQTHFLFTTGAKLFSVNAGAPAVTPLSDASPELYALQKDLATSAPLDLAKQGTQANTLVIDEAEAHGVRSYVFVPCIVYGCGRGFGNRVSIQTVAIVRAARALRKVYALDEGRPAWPVCHVDDNSALYVELLRAMLEGREDVPSGKSGFYLAASGSVAWVDLYAALGKAMEGRGVVDVAEVQEWDGVDGEVLEGMWRSWGYPGDAVPEIVKISVGGECNFTAENGRKIGWQPKYKPEHVLEAAEEEVDLILENLRD